MLEALLKLTQTSQSMIGKVVVRNVLNPLLWLSAVALTFCLPFAYALSERWLKYVLVLAPVGVVLFTCMAYVYFAIRSPGRLQSEEFRLQQKALQIAQASGMRLEI